MDDDELTFDGIVTFDDDDEIPATFQDLFSSDDELSELDDLDREIDELMDF